MPNPMTKFLLFFVCIAFIAKPLLAEDNATTAELRSVLEARLAQMPLVARYKWQNSISVEDLDREAIILSNTVNQAKKLGIRELTARRLVVAQMTAAKMIQNRLISGWQEASGDQPSLPPLKSLSEDIRPTISHLTAELLRLTAALEDELETCRAHKLLWKNGSNAITDAEWQTAVAGLKPKELVCR